MTAHQAIIETGPGTVRRLCCGTSRSANNAMAALAGIDDPVTLIDGQPVSIAELWVGVLRSLACDPEARGEPQDVLIVHPSWWSTARVDLVAAAARTLFGDVVTQPRSQLLTAGVPVNRAGVVVEIAARVVAITVSGTVAEPRSGSPTEVVEAVVRRIVAVTRGATATVLIDGPGSVGGAAVLAEMIAERLRAVRGDATVALVDDNRLTRPVVAMPGRDQPARPNPTSGRDRGACRIPALLAAGVVLSVAALGAGAWHRRPAPTAEVMPMTFLVEGRVALQVPARWPVQRVTTGPGSARVQVVSPSDPQVALHVTQSPAPGGTLAATAESLKQAFTQANATESANIFVDFNPSAVSAGRPAVTYRELRPDHHIDWTVLVDGVVRVGIGCQSAPGRAETVRAACDQAVRSAHALR